VKNLVIYTITNKVNGKKYVGQSRRGFRPRKSEHLHRFNLGERDHKLYQAMREHGLENFVFEVVCCALKPEYLDELEIFFIEKFNSFRRGYNMTCGGDSISDETRAKISAAHKGRKITWAHKSVATRKLRGLYGPENCTVRGSKSRLSKSYLIRHPDGAEHRVTGIRQFCRDNGLDHSTLFQVLAGKQRHHKGYTLIARFND
jgi:group I intron endonuclease